MKNISTQVLWQATSDSTDKEHCTLHQCYGWQQVIHYWSKHVMVICSSNYRLKNTQVQATFLTMRRSCQGSIKVTKSIEMRKIQKKIVWGFPLGQCHPCYVDECLPSAHLGAIAPINIDDMHRANKNIHQTIYITSLGTIVFSLEILYLIFPPNIAIVF